MQSIFDHISSADKQLEILEEAGHESFIHEHEADAFRTLILNYIR